ncbi:hypothetical protein SAMN05518849_12113 [Sphingobium sp. AP50]|nr:hypothetical protein SAMN05518849_12113 [Sphingobium sp. AP50]
MSDETWVLGESLDALDDMLYGGYGAIAGAASVEIIWKDIAVSRKSLGADTTLEFLQARHAIRDQFNGQSITQQMEALLAGAGNTYFDIVMEVFASHRSIKIVAS